MLSMLVNHKKPTSFGWSSRRFKVTRCWNSTHLCISWYSEDHCFNGLLKSTSIFGSDLFHQQFWAAMIINCFWLAGYSLKKHHSPIGVGAEHSPIHQLSLFVSKTHLLDVFGKKSRVPLGENVLEKHFQDIFGVKFVPLENPRVPTKGVTFSPSSFGDVKSMKSFAQKQGWFWINMAKSRVTLGGSFQLASGYIIIVNKGG